MFYFQVLLGQCNTLPNSKRYVMEPKGFMGYFGKGSASELNSFGHEQYPYNTLNQNNVSPWCLQTTPKKVLLSFQVLVWLCNTPPYFNRYVMEPKGFLIQPKRGIAHALSNYGHKQYPSNSLDQNNSIHIFTNYSHKGITFLLGFVRAMQYPSMILQICYGAK